MSIKKEETTRMEKQSIWKRLLARAYNRLGFYYYQKWKLEPAIRAWNKAVELNPELTLELNPKLARAYNSLGLAYADQGNLDRAIQDYDKAIELNPKYAEAYKNRGNAYDRKGNLDQAIHDYTKAIALNPKYADAYYNRGNAYKKKGELDLANQDFKAKEIIDSASRSQGASSPITSSPLGSPSEESFKSPNFFKKF